MDCGPQGPLGLGSRTWGSRDTECEVALILEASQLKKLVDLEVWGGTWQGWGTKEWGPTPYPITHFRLLVFRFPGGSSM